MKYYLCLGKIAYHCDEKNPSWLPTLHMGYETRNSTQDAVNRYRRSQFRNFSNKVPDAVQSLIDLSKSEVTVESNEEANLEKEISEENQDIDEGSIETCDENEQTELTGDILLGMEGQLQDMLTRIDNNKLTIYDFEFFKKNPEKVPFYTGLPSIEVLEIVFELVKPKMASNLKALSKEQEFLLCLVKLRLFNYIAYQLGVSCTTVQRSFHNTLEVLFYR